MESEKVCGRCRNINSADAKYCATCGAPLDTVPESDRPAVDDELALRYVDPNNRVELDRFERWDEAALACGLLRSNDIACELSPMPLPGLPADIMGAQPRCQTGMGIAGRRGGRGCCEEQRFKLAIYRPSLAILFAQLGPDPVAGSTTGMSNSG
jgi:hypothetical protein